MIIDQLAIGSQKHCNIMVGTNHTHVLRSLDIRLGRMGPLTCLRPTKKQTPYFSHATLFYLLLQSSNLNDLSSPHPKFFRKFLPHCVFLIEFFNNFFAFNLVLFVLQLNLGVVTLHVICFLCFMYQRQGIFALCFGFRFLFSLYYYFCNLRLSLFFVIRLGSIGQLLFVLRIHSLYSLLFLSKLCSLCFCPKIELFVHFVSRLQI